MTELKVKCSSCGHIERVAKVNTFTIASNENEQFKKWLEEHDKEIKAQAYDEAFAIVLEEEHQITTFADKIGIKILKMKAKLLEENKR